jgi:hypothetical protein
MHVIGIGNAGISLMQSKCQSMKASSFRLLGSDYLWADFYWPTSNPQAMPMRALIELMPNNFELIMPFFEPELQSIITDLKGIPAARAFIESRKQEIVECVRGVNTVLLIIGLDCTIAFAACDIVAKIARQSGALVISLVCMSIPSLGTANQDAIFRLSNESDCVIFSEGMWEAYHYEFEPRIWEWGYGAGVISVLNHCFHIPDVDTSRVKKILSESRYAAYGVGFGYSADESVEMAIGNGLMGNWGDRIAESATGAIIVVSGHSLLIAQMLDSVQESFTKTLPINTGIKTIWRGKPEWCFVTKCLDEPSVDVFYCIDVIFTGVRF